MRKIKEITIDGKPLSEILELHKKWRNNENNGKRADLSGADLSGADLSGAYLSGADLRGAYLIGADLRGAYLIGADLRGAYLIGADLRGAYLSGAYLSGADLRGAYLIGADLRGAYLSGANLIGADLRGAYLSGAKDIIAIGPIGSRGDFIFAIRHDKAIMIKTGCFWCTLEEFKTQVKQTHNENEYAQAYAAAIVFIRKYFAAAAAE